MTIYQKVRVPPLPDGKVQILWNSLENGKRTYVDHDVNGNIRRRHVHTYKGKETEMFFWRKVETGACIVTEHGPESIPPKRRLTALQYLALVNGGLEIDDAGVLLTDKSNYVDI